MGNMWKGVVGVISEGWVGGSCVKVSGFYQGYPGVFPRLSPLYCVCVV